MICVKKIVSNWAEILFRSVIRLLLHLNLNSLFTVHKQLEARCETWLSRKNLAFPSPSPNLASTRRFKYTSLNLG